MPSTRPQREQYRTPPAEDCWAKKTLAASPQQLSVDDPRHRGRLPARLCC
jgi:hypothetical protein